MQRQAADLVDADSAPAPLSRQRASRRSRRRGSPGNRAGSYFASSSRTAPDSVSR